MVQLRVVLVVWLCFLFLYLPYFSCSSVLLVLPAFDISFLFLSKRFLFVGPEDDLDGVNVLEYTTGATGQLESVHARSRGESSSIFPPGIVNLGVTCYLSCAFHCLASLPPVVEGMASCQALLLEASVPFVLSPEECLTRQKHLVLMAAAVNLLTSLTAPGKFASALRPDEVYNTAVACGFVSRGREEDSLVSSMLQTTVTCLTVCWVVASRSSLLGF